MEILDVKNREEFRAWLFENAGSAKECFVACKRGKPDGNAFSYLDAVEEALCFGWIDSVTSSVNGQFVQRFSPRVKKSPWTELNKERCRRLIRLNLMTEYGEKTLPNLDEPFIIPTFYIDALKSAGALENFFGFPPLYQRIRIYNLEFHKSRSKPDFQKMLDNFLEHTKNNKMYGEWNDYGRLIDNGQR